MVDVLERQRYVRTEKRRLARNRIPFRRVLIANVTCLNPFATARQSLFASLSGAVVLAHVE